MGKPTGFLEYERRVSEEVAPLERIKNFNEFHIPRRWKNSSFREHAVWHAECRLQYGKLNGRHPLSGEQPLPEWRFLSIPETGNRLTTV